MPEKEDITMNKINESYDKIKIPSSNLKDFKKLWKEDGGKILEETEEEIVASKNGKKVYLMKVGDTVFPYDITEEK